MTHQQLADLGVVCSPGRAGQQLAREAAWSGSPAQGRGRSPSRGGSADRGRQRSRSASPGRYKSGVGHLTSDDFTRDVCKTAQDLGIGVTRCIAADLAGHDPEFGGWLNVCSNNTGAGATVCHYEHPGAEWKSERNKQRLSEGKLPPKVQDFPPEEMKRILRAHPVVQAKPPENRARFTQDTTRRGATSPGRQQRQGQGQGW